MSLKQILLVLGLIILTSQAIEDIQCHSEQSPNTNYPLLRLPRIDISKYLHGTISEKEEVISSFKQYIHEYSSFSLFNHGIPSSLIDRMESSGLEFFNRDNDYKSKYASNGIGTPGYEPLKTLSASKSYGDLDNDGDYTEMYSFFNHLYGTDDYQTYHPLQENAPSELFNASMEYIPMIQNLLYVIHNISSEALGLEQNYFNSMYTKSHMQLRYFYYPKYSENKTAELIDNGKFRVSPHKDWLGYTLFHAGRSRGLQNKIGGENGVWMDCATDNEVEYDIFVNVGELFDIWTNDYWPGNIHRVILDNQERITFSFFTGPDDDTIIEPIEGCYECNMDEQKHPSRTAAQHAKMRFSTGDNQNPNGEKFYNVKS